MPSKRLQVLAAIKALIAAALPNADVRGLDAESAKPSRPPPGGLVIVRSGDPGEPTVDLSPLSYNYEHAVPIEVIGYDSANKTSEQVLDEMTSAIGAAIAANRTLGGLCDWLEGQAPTTEDFDATGAEAGDWADFLILVSYATSNPLT